MTQPSGTIGGVLSTRAVGGLLLIAWTAHGVAATPADAHQRAELEVVVPSEGAQVPVGPVDVVISAAGGTLSRSDFSVRLDGQPVDTSGRVGAGSVFTTFSLAAGEQVRLQVSVRRPGQHELRLEYAADADDPRPDVVRRFTVGAEPGGRPLRPRRAVPVGLALAGAAALGAALLLRRRLTASPEEPGRHLRD